MWFVFCLLFLDLKANELLIHRYPLMNLVLSISFNELGQIEALMFNPFLLSIFYLHRIYTYFYSSNKSLVEKLFIFEGEYVRVWWIDPDLLSLLYTII